MRRSMVSLQLQFKKYLKILLDLDIGRAAPLGEVLVGRGCSGLLGDGPSDCNYFPLNSTP